MVYSVCMECLEDRNQKIYNLIESGDYTLQEVGDMYGVTRERIRQLHSSIRRKMGLPKGARKFLKKRKIESIKKKEQKLDEIKYWCSICSTPVSFRQAGNKSALCQKCHDTYDNHRNPHITRVCKQCGKKFHPPRGFGYPSQKSTGNYCSSECYLESGKWYKARAKEAKKRRDEAKKEFDRLWNSGAFKYASDVKRLIAKKFNVTQHSVDMWYYNYWKYPIKK